MTNRDIDFTHPAFDTTPQWRTRAACAQPLHHLINTIEPAGTTPDWFPEQHHARDAATEKAYTICRTCPVQLQCLRFALITDRHKDRGIFGGLGPRARSQLRARLTAKGLLPVARICANPGCRKEFPAKPNTPRDNVCCSNSCRVARRRLLGRAARAAKVV